MILSIDTSTRQAGLALAGSEGIVAELSWIAAGNHSQTLTAALRFLLQLSGAETDHLRGIAVARGPGSFSGLRVGISEAKGLAMALDVPLVGVSTLDVIGFQASCYGGHVWAVLPAGREQVYAAEYRGIGQPFAPLGGYHLLSLDEAAERMQGAAVAGEAARDVIDRVASQHGRPASPPHCDSVRRAGFLAELGRRRLSAGDADERDVLEPLYLRRSAAEEKRAATAGE